MLGSGLVRYLISDLGVCEIGLGRAGRENWQCERQGAKLRSWILSFQLVIVKLESPVGTESQQ